MLHNARVCLLGILLAGTACTDADYRLRGHDEPRGAYFSLVTKGSVARFYNRLADNQLQFVATSQPVQGALKSSRLFPATDERLVMVELHSGSPAVLPGELDRFGNFAVISASYDADLHMVAGVPTLYGEELAARERTSPAVDKSLMEFTVTEQEFAGSPELASSLVIKPDVLVTELRQLSGDLPVSLNGKELRISERRLDENKAHARAWLRQQYEALGFTVAEVPYQGRSFGTNANFVAEKAGSDTSRVLIVSSHLDSVGNAGADDNGSGTISALAMARALKDASLKYNLRIVAFDEEELGLVGSEAYAQSLADSGEINRVVGVINMEMTGYNARGDGSFHVMDCNENSSEQLSRVFKNVAARDPELKLKPVAACTSRSDHASFWRAGKPAVVLSENFFGGDANPCYHKNCDKVSGVNFDYMARLTTLLTRVSLELLTR